MSRWSLAACLVVTLVAASCSVGDEAASTPKNGTRAKGLQIVLPDGAEATVTERPTTDVLADRVATPGLEVAAAWHVSGDKLAEPARMIFEVPDGAAADDGFVVTRETDDDPWTVLDAVPAQREGHLTATVRHFSQFALILFDVTEFLREVLFPSTGSGAARPVPNCPAPPPGATVAVGSADSMNPVLAACVDGTNGTTTLQIADLRDLPLHADLRPGDQVVGGYNLDDLTGWVVQLVMEQRGGTSVIVPPNGTVGVQLNSPGSPATYGFGLDSDVFLLERAWTLVTTLLGARADVWKQVADGAAVAKSLVECEARNAIAPDDVASLVSKCLPGVYEITKRLASEALPGGPGAIATALLETVGTALAIGDELGAIMTYVTAQATSAGGASVAYTPAPDRNATSDCPAEGSVSEFERAARCLYDAWQRDDRQRAADFAEPAAVAELFDYVRAEWEFQGCDQGYEDSWLGWGCSYVAENRDTGYAVGIGFTFVAYDDVTVVSHVSSAG